MLPPTPTQTIVAPNHTTATTVAATVTNDTILTATAIVVPNQTIAAAVADSATINTTLTATANPANDTNPTATAIIVPIHKGGLKSQPQNYRPINLISHILKVLEKLIRNHLVYYLEEQELMNPNQHAFRKYRS